MEEDGLPDRSPWGMRIAVAFVILAFPLAVFLYVYQMTDWFKSEPESVHRDREEAVPTADTFMEAVMYGDQAKVEWYISQGVELNTVSDEFLPWLLPLETAIDYRRYKIAKLLLDAGASPNACIDDELAGIINDLPLNLAVKRRDRVAIGLLIEAGADPNLFVEHSGPALHLAVGGPHGIMEFLLEHGAEIDAPDKVGQTALHWAASRPAARSIKFLLSHGADINAQDNCGKTPLHRCIDDLETTETLLKAGADPDIGADMNQRFDDSDPPFASLYSTEFPYPHQIALKNWSGWTVLHCAAAIGDADYVNLLLEHGARVDTEDAKGRTPLDIAHLEGHANIVTLLEEWIKDHPQPEEGHNGHAE